MRAYVRDALLLFAAVSVVASAASVTSYGQSQTGDKALPPEYQRRIDEFNSQFPVVDFEDAGPSDPGERERRRKRNAFYDNQHFVRKDDGDGKTVAASLTDEWDFTIPPLPATQSAVILTGEVTGARAYLSNDKTGIYSEFPVRVEEVLKNSGPAQLKAGGLAYPQRTGGAVLYPNGKKYMYTVSAQNMPRVGLRYVFFLKPAGDEESFQIITAFELRGSKVFPLDSADLFDAYMHMEQSTFFERLKSAIAGK